MELQDANLQLYEKNSFTHPRHDFCLHFLRIHQVTSFEETLKVYEHNFFQEIQAESSVTCNLPVQLRLI